MGWREKILETIGPGNFAGITLGDWLRVLQDNRWAVSPSFLPRAISISGQAIPNTILRWVESFQFQRQWNAESTPSPLFILGHYRHGTTHLHNLLSVDDRFCFPTMYQVSYPHTFLTTERLGAWLLRHFTPEKRPFDNVRLGIEVPAEDEMAAIILAGVSPYLSGVFPRRATVYDSHLTFENASETDLQRWQHATLLFYAKLTLRYDRPLVVKSPTHTARIRWLLEMFPDAKFVHIHRNPFDVFRSTLKMVTAASPWFRLQSDHVDWVERTIRVYNEMYDAFFEQRDLIPSAGFYEIGYEDLVANPRSELRRLYEDLGLPSFSEVEDNLSHYLTSLSHYQTNRFAPLAQAESELVATQWKRSFEEWGYEIPTHCP